MKRLIFVIMLCCFSLVGFAEQQTQSTALLQQRLQSLRDISTKLQNEKLTAAKTKQLTSQIAGQAQVQQLQIAGAEGPVGFANMSDDAFAGVVQKKLPMTPAQIGMLHKAFDQTQQSAARPPNVPPRPSTSAIQIDLSPHATPPVIRLGAGYISSLVFIDASGQPWPIQAYSVGDPSSFNIQWDKQSNTLFVQSDTFYKRSNLAVMLRGLNTPIMLSLLPGQTAVDYRVDLRIPALGPNAQLMHAGLPDGANPMLLDILNGVPPKHARNLTVKGSDETQAWLVNNKLYVRTSLDIVSPAWDAIMSSVDGTHAYEMQPTSVLLALQHGRDKMIKLILEGLG